MSVSYQTPFWRINAVEGSHPPHHGGEPAFAKPSSIASRPVERGRRSEMKSGNSFSRCPRKRGNKTRTKQTFLNGALNPLCLPPRQCRRRIALYDRRSIVPPGCIGMRPSNSRAARCQSCPRAFPGLAGIFLSVYPFGADGFIASARFCTQGQHRTPASQQLRPLRSPRRR